MGNFKNDVFGDYIRYTHASCHSYVVVNIDGKILGTRQNGRYTTSRLKNIQHVGENVNEILRAIGAVNEYRHACMEFGKGNSTEELVSVLKSEEFWKINIQKRFIDLDIY